MIKVVFGDNWGGVYVDSFENIEEAESFANKDIRKLTILSITEENEG